MGKVGYFAARCPLGDNSTFLFLTPKHTHNVVCVKVFSLRIFEFLSPNRKVEEIFLRPLFFSEFFLFYFKSLIFVVVAVC